MSGTYGCPQCNGSGIYYYSKTSSLGDVELRECEFCNLPHAKSSQNKVEEACDRAWEKTWEPR